jgi:hypothetical protein
MDAPGQKGGFCDWETPPVNCTILVVNISRRRIWPLHSTASCRPATDINKVTEPRPAKGAKP